MSVALYCFAGGIPVSTTVRVMSVSFRTLSFVFLFTDEGIVCLAAVCEFYLSVSLSNLKEGVVAYGLSTCC